MGITSRRNWATYLRRLGLLSPLAIGPPVEEGVQPVTLVGDESRLREYWSGPYGICGGPLQDALFGGIPRLTVQAGPAGCWVSLKAFSVEVTASFWYDFYDAPVNLLLNSIPGSRFRPLISNGEPELAVQSVVWIDNVANVAAAGIPNNAVTGAPDASTYQVLGGQKEAYGAFGPLWVGPNRLWVLVINGTDFFVQVIVEEPGAARQGTGL